MRILLLVFGWLLIPEYGWAQPERFELGRRLNHFEKAWDQNAGAEGRKRALPLLNQAVRNFFGFNFGNAGRSLDQARHALISAEATPTAVQWAESIYAIPEARLVDAEQKETLVTLKPFYKVEGEVPPKLQARVRIGKGAWSSVEIGKLPAEVKASWKGAADDLDVDTVLILEVLQNEKVLAHSELAVSRSKGLEARQKKLTELVQTFVKPLGIEQASLEYRLNIIRDLAEKRTLETNYPAARFLRECEELAQVIAAKKPYFNLEKPGETWLAIPIPDRAPAPIRVFIPEKLATDKPVPVVVALHGAGGSENMFFDAYGDGIVRKMCQERGWIMIATRVVGIFGAGGVPPVTTVLDAVSKRYPIDSKHTYLIGHSMGAGHAMALAQQYPDKWAGVAALGGGAVLRKPEVCKDLPIFVGCGKADFALAGAKNLAQSLKKAEATHLVFKEYEDIEHLAIVPIAMPEVFQFFEKLLKEPAKPK